MFAYHLLSAQLIQGYTKFIDPKLKLYLGASGVSKSRLSEGGVATKIYQWGTKCPRTTTHDDRLLTSNDRKASFCRQTVEVPNVSAYVGGGVTSPTTPSSSCSCLELCWYCWYSHYAFDPCLDNEYELFLRQGKRPREV